MPETFKSFLKSIKCPSNVKMSPVASRFLQLVCFHRNSDVVHAGLLVDVFLTSPLSGFLSLLKLMKVSYFHSRV